MAEEHRGYTALLFPLSFLTRLTPFSTYQPHLYIAFSGLDPAAALRGIAKNLLFATFHLLFSGPLVIRSAGAILRGALPS